MYVDPDACRLTQRLAGLPLALVTAGAYLRKTVLTFRQYLEAYDQRFNINPRRPIQLQEYQDRTLYTTWNLSYSRLEGDDPLAANALKLFAYFDNQEIWYELLHTGLADDLPPWLHDLAAEQVDFESTMGTLVEYCLLEVHPGTQSYSIHNCVHDWTLAELNKIVNPQLHWYAQACVVANIDKDDWQSLDQLHHARLACHALRCANPRFEQCLPSVFSQDRLDEGFWIALLLDQQVHFLAAECMYRRALVGYEKVLGAEHTSTLETVNNLGVLYWNQGKVDEAEQMYERALAGLEKALGAEHTSTLETVHNLGVLYRDQGKLDEAEQMYERALAGFEKILGQEHRRTLDACKGLASIRQEKDKKNSNEQTLDQPEVR